MIFDLGSSNFIFHFRFIDKDLVNVLFTVYFFVLGVFALARAVEPLLRGIVPLPTMVQYKLLLLSDEKPKPVESEDSEDKQNEKEVGRWSPEVL